MATQLPVTGRRSHRKSRNGCQQCKARKVKCDEGRPTCRNCKKHHVECSFFATTNGSPSPYEVSDTPLISTHADPAAGQTTSTAPELAISDLELLHHFSTSTAYTFSQHPAIQTFWRVNAPRIGFSAPYALRAILAISALHLAHLRPHQKKFYVNQAEYHHDAAVKQVAPNMTHLMQEDSAGVLLFSMLTSFISCAKPRKLDDFLLFRRGEVSEWLVFFRGSGTIVKYARDSLSSGPMAAILNIRGNRTEFRNSLVTDQKSFMSDLEVLIREEVRDMEELKIYLDALEEMKRSYVLWTDQCPTQWETDDVFVWPLGVSQEFLELLREQRPVALVIFGFFCPLLHRLEWMWWINGWAIHLLSRIHGLLDAAHRSWIQWPMEQLGWCT
ncbi:hypothetical protein P170DRAFT_436441 [Aspergillus steynii IBT 23096]|uniref:Zn(2)-C6 fungal-type domain-containing protein n=1 Tax=Aspergillus steynii IBT 23096 TaxID=1392250 RepID=A0A2I2G6X1_9EURO|nr:uncharacterized protein P170DRAFT_436441 [Aspergillus steynii IBT 23096]PLB48627.1 hypothetical protein P170DRAFT_436441 [Aspergillus steynii IBT 23096]